MTDRLDRVRSAMADRGVGAMLLSVGNDLPYLTGYRAMPLERLTMAVIRLDGLVALVVPRLEAPRVAAEPFLDVIAWDETADPVSIVADLVGDTDQVAVGDETWARFLLELEAALPGARFGPASPITSAVRILKTDEEIAHLSAAAAAADRVADRLVSVRFSGRSEREVAGDVGRMLIEEGCEAVSFVIVASGPNSASPHHEPGDRVMATGDAVVVDFGGSVAGYHSDTTRNFHVGAPSSEYERAHEVLVGAQQAGFDAAVVGTSAEDVDAAARAVIVNSGYGEFFIHRTGHGIGLDVHEAPYIVAGNERRLEPRMAFSIEPGIYIPGEFGLRIEDIVVASSDGPLRLNRSNRQLRIVG